MTASVRPATGPDVRGDTAWAASFLGFPIGGLAAIAAVGRVDSPTAALVGGAQVLATRALRVHDLRRRRRAHLHRRGRPAAARRAPAPHAVLTAARP